MMRIAAVVLGVMISAVALPARAEIVSLGAISDYLNRLRTAETAFTQINPDGSGSKGRVLISRPGRMRFEYAAPDKTLVLASAGQIAIFDGKSNQPPEQYPLAKTPLKLILGRKIDLERDAMVVAHREDGKYTVVTAQDPGHPELGTLDLAFTPNPVTLRQWVVTDEAGGQTTVVLEALTEGKDYPPSTFSIETELAARGLD